MSSALIGRIAIVTGANHGIGAATALALARLGADVGLTYLPLTPHNRPEEPSDYVRVRSQDASEVVAGIEAAGRRAVAVKADLADPASPARIFEAVETDLGAVSILINNASGWRKDSFAAGGVDQVGRRNHPVTADSVDAQLLVDARGSALMVAELARRHRDRGGNWGRIVSLTSGGPAGFPGEVSYGAAKAALENYTMAAAVELAGVGITANVVYPPITDTGWITDEVRQVVAHSSDHQHIAAPSQVAEVIAWLCTDAAHLVTGSLIRLR